jgi:NAD(P) transhydrogenase
MEQGRIAVCDAFGVPGSEAIDASPDRRLLDPRSRRRRTHRAGSGAAGHGLRDRARTLLLQRARGNISGATEGLVKLVFRRDDRTVIGAHILVEVASELIHIGQPAIHHRDTIEYFLDTTFNVPTYAEAYKDAAYDGLQRLAATSTLEALLRS